MVPGCSGPLTLVSVDVHGCPQQPRGAGGVTPDLHWDQESWGGHLKALVQGKLPFYFHVSFRIKAILLGSKHGMFVKFMRAFREAFREYILSLLL